MFPVFQIKDIKLDSGQSCSGKQLTYRGKREREQSTKENEKLEGFRSPDRRNSSKVKTQNHFFLLVAV